MILTSIIAQVITKERHAPNFKIKFRNLRQWIKLSFKLYPCSIDLQGLSLCPETFRNNLSGLTCNKSQGKPLQDLTSSNYQHIESFEQTQPLRHFHDVTIVLCTSVDCPLLEETELYCQNLDQILSLPLTLEERRHPSKELLHVCVGEGHRKKFPGLRNLEAMQEQYISRRASVHSMENHPSGLRKLKHHGLYRVGKAVHLSGCWIFQLEDRIYLDRQETSSSIRLLRKALENVAEIRKDVEQKRGSKSTGKKLQIHLFVEAC